MFVRCLLPLHYLEAHVGCLRATRSLTVAVIRQRAHFRESSNTPYDASLLPTASIPNQKSGAFFLPIYTL